MSQKLLKKNQANRTEDLDRPWGRFWQYTHNEKSTVKIIQVDPGKRLSYQKHQKRSEIWVAIDPGLYAIINDEEFKLKPGQTVEIPAGTKHRMGNQSDQPARWLEISLGNFNEADNIRLQDDFDRN